MVDEINNYKQYASNYFHALANKAIMIFISRSALKDFPRNLSKESKEHLNADIQFMLDRRKLKDQGFLTVEDYDQFTKDYDPITKFSILSFVANHYTIDALIKLRKAKNADAEISEMLVRDAFRKDFLDQNNVPDRDIKIKDFNAKFGLPNVLTINFARENIVDLYTDTINYNQQLLSQIVITCLAQFEYFLARSIKLFIATTRSFQTVTEKNEKGKRVTFLLPTVKDNTGPLKIPLPNLKWLKFLSLYEFVSHKKIDLLYNVTEKHNEFFKRFWIVRNLLVHNGGIIDERFAKSFDLPLKKIGSSFELDFDQVGILFFTIWRFSLRIYACLTNNR
ncbi:MAG: hypothetical protein JXA54_03420 [Candidatus Heimdallarchaeota archaeon]|nr:hypothetical protein [Candidatus Heimdallarchaeota archaeon]